MFVVVPTWGSFRDVVQEQYYLVGSYDDQYTKWTMLQQERDQTVLELTNVLYALRTKLGIKDSKRHLVLKYRGNLH